MRALLATVTLLPALAFAGWRSVGPQGQTIVDVEMIDAGVVLVTSQGAGGNASLLQVTPDGGVTPLLSMAGTYLGSAVFGNCLVTLESGGNVRHAAACGNTDFTATTSPRAMRGFGADGLAILQLSGSTLTLLIGNRGSTTTVPFGGASWGVSNSDAVPRTLRYGAQDVIVVNPITAGFRVSIDGGAPGSTSYPNGSFRDFALFDRAGAPAVMAASRSTGLLWFFPDIRTNAASSFTVDGGAAHVAISDVSMVVTLDGGLASPIPDPANAFVSWRPRNAFGATFDRISCLPSRWCAASDLASNLWVYENANGPLVQAPANVTADAGAVVRLTLDAGDLDDDPLFHTWSAGSGAVVIDVAGVEDGVAKDLSLPVGVCGAVPVTVTTTDGLNLTTTMFDVTVGGRGAFGVTAPTMMPFAGGGPVTYAAFVDGGCESAMFAWSTTDGQTGMGPTFDYQPAATVCGTSETITVTAQWQSGAPVTTNTQVVVTPTPWGAPFAPQFQRPATQLTGTTQVWSPLNAEHACLGTGGYPGTALIWDLVDAGATTVTIVDGGLQVDAQANCIASQVYAVAHREVVGEMLGRRSDAGTLVIDVIPDIPPLGANAMYGLTAFADSGVAYGDTTLMASCLAQRDVASKIFVFDGTTQVAATSTVTPGPWSIPVPGGCAGGAREVVAQLYEDAGFTGAEQRAMITFDSTPAAVGPMTPTALIARCGEGVRGRLTLSDVPGTCSAVERTWRQLEGAALVTTSGSDAIDLQTVALDFSMVGQPITFEWSVDAGAGNGATEQRTLDVGVEPFISVSSRTRPRVRREESAFELEITLTNTTQCAVEGLDVELPLTSAEPLAGTLTLDGARLESSVEGNVLRASGVSMPAGGKVVLKLAASPRLLGSPATTPSVTLRGLPVSIIEPPAVPATGCGCSSEPGVAAVLLAFFALGRRRRRE